MRIKSVMKSLTHLILAGLCASAMPTYATSQQELTGVKSEISRQRSSLTSQQKQLDELQKSLKEQEIAISKIEKEIKKTTTSLTLVNDKINNFEDKVAEQEQQQQTQKQQLKALIRAYYVTQRSIFSTQLLKEGVEEDRINQYFQHLAKERTKLIAKLNQTNESLVQSRSQLNHEKSRLETLLQQQSDERRSLAKNQADRKSTIGKIKTNIKDDKRYLAELRRNETRLKAEIAKAKAAVRNSVPMDGLSKQKGKLPWPLQGRVLHGFGSTQTGQINRKGMVLSADYGQKVNSIYSGTVVFADYLRGYGLVVLLDHGKGDMTLYGYNQVLLKKEGDKVKAGETLALVGDTGGQDQASLYFEIRRNSEAQNPKYWLKKL